MKIGSTIVLTIIGDVLIGLRAYIDHKNEGQFRDTVNTFTQAYFSWQFNDALAHYTPSSRRWISYAASQVKQDDVDKLRSIEQGARSEIEKIYCDEGNSVASVVMKIENFLSIDSLEAVRYLVESATYTL